MRKLGCACLAIIIGITILLNMSSYGEVSASSLDANLSATSYVVIDENGKVLIDKNPDDKREVASICKLMTTLITLENIESGNITLDDKVVASNYACAVEGSQAFLDAGSEYTVRDLVKSVIVASANDSAIVLAESIAGSESAFVDLMNSRARELGMTNTLYANSTGLNDGKSQYSTARDTAIILNEISNYDIYKEDCKIWMDKLIHPSGRETELVNTNRLIKYYPYCLTGKTGYTDEAGYCLSSTALKDNLKLTCVVLGCDSSADRFSDSVALYNSAYANFKSEKIIDKTILIANDIIVERGKEDNLEVVASEDYYLTISRRTPTDYSISYKFDDKVTAPVKVGDVIGVAQVIVDGEIVDEINIVSNTNVNKQSFRDIINKITENYSIIKHSN